MARKGLLRLVQVPPGPVAADTLALAQNNARDAIERLAADDDLVQAPAVSLSLTSAIPTTATVVVYRGGAGQTVSLPAAASRGQSMASVLYFINASSVAVTVARSASDTLNGGASLSLATGKMAVLVSDGVSLWKAVTS